MGASVEQVPVVRFSHSRSVREVIDGIASRTHSHTWGIPEDILTVTVRELREWAAQEFKDSNLIFEEESEFILDIARFARITS
jgi:hypothetical protein